MVYWERNNHSKNHCNYLSVRKYRMNHTRFLTKKIIIMDNKFDRITVTSLHQKLHLKLQQNRSVSVISSNSPQIIQDHEKGHSPLDLEHHLPYTSPKGHLYLIQQPSLQPNLSMHDQKLQVLFLVVHTHSQSIKILSSIR